MNFTLCKNRCNYTNRNKQPRTPLFPSNPSKTALSLALHHHACLMNAPLALRPCKALGRSTSGIHARPLSKVRCCRPKEFGRLPEGLLYTHQPLHLHNHFKRTIIPRSTSVLLYNTSITQKSVHRLIRQLLEQLHRKTGTQRRNNSTLPCSHYRKIKKQQ